MALKMMRRRMRKDCIEENRKKDNRSVKSIHDCHHDLQLSLLK